MARKTKQEAEETRENILKAALDIFFEKGYARSTFVDVANRIQLTKGAVYWHFKNKPDLFISLGKEMENKIEASLVTAMENAQTLEDLKQVLIEMILFIAKDPQLQKYYTIVYYRTEWTDELMSIKKFFDEQESLMVDWFLQILGHAQSTTEMPKDKNISHLSRALLGLVNGLLADCLVTPPLENKNETTGIVHAGLNTFFTGLRTMD